MDQPTIIQDISKQYSDLDYAIYHPKYNNLMKEDVEEYVYFKAVLATFFNYMMDFNFEEKRLIQSLESLTIEQKTLMKYDYVQLRVPQYRLCLLKNSEFLFKVVMGYCDLFVELQNIKTIYDIPELKIFNQSNVNKIRITLKQFVRDWSSDGKLERIQCYSPLIDFLKAHFPDSQQRTKKYKALVPGSGLGRVVYELAKLGFSAQGNEYSYFMLLASNFILNLSQMPDQFTIFPFFNNHLNKRQESEIYQPIYIPDEAPCQHIKQGDDMSMVAGEFNSVYGQQIEQWDAVVTCFFIDTSENIVKYIQTIYNILKKGGVWVNMGPLEYHFSKKLLEVSIEISWEEIEHIIKTIGFEIESWQYTESTYNYHKCDGKKLIYDCVIFKVVKK